MDVGRIFQLTIRDRSWHADGYHSWPQKRAGGIELKAAS
jgi:hypothetical protein